MKTFSSICAIASTAALLLSPVSIELSISLVVAIGMVALLAKDYGQAVAPVGAQV